MILTVSIFSDQHLGVFMCVSVKVNVFPQEKNESGQAIYLNIYPYT